MAQMSFYCEATYRGRDGGPDGVFGFGSGYVLEVQQILFGQLVIHACHGHEYKRLEGTRIKYQSLFAFLRDWDIGRVWRGFYSH